MRTPSPTGFRWRAPRRFARRFEVVLICGLQQGELPRGSWPSPSCRTRIAAPSPRRAGLVLPVREDRLERERYLYVSVSRAERLLVLSSRSSDEEENPEAESYFVDDVRALLAPGAELRTLAIGGHLDAGDGAHRRRVGSRAGRGRAEAHRAGPRAARRRAAASRAGRPRCGVGGRYRALRRLPGQVARGGRPASRAGARPEAVVRGDYAHTVLEHTYRRLREETGERRVTHANLASAERILLEELRARSSAFRLSPKATRVRAASRRLEFDLLRHLRSEADSDSRFEPEHLELRFGYGEGSSR